MKPAHDKDYDNFPKRDLIIRMIVAECLLEFRNAEFNRLRDALLEIEELPNSTASRLAEKALDTCKPRPRRK